ncbi:MAG: recombination protein O N-terminal domain-containing protein [Myxococcota bacterium]
MSLRRAPLRLQGIIVRQRNFAESDRIIELLTADFGRITCIARGARASKRRFRGVLDLL